MSVLEQRARSHVELRARLLELDSLVDSVLEELPNIQLQDDQEAGQDVD
jgi:SOS response regulatory protein OraA/RecX